MPLHRGLAAALLLALPAWAAAGAAAWGEVPVPELRELQPAAVIVDDIGTDLRAGRRAIRLPEAVALSVLPYTSHARPLAERAYRQGHEVMAHLPMQPNGEAHPGPEALWLDTPEPEVRRRVRKALRAVPHARGVNNHMGSLVTRHPGHMAWVMEEIAGRGGLYFVDSRTTARTVAQQLAAEHGIPNAAREVFLDPQRDAEVIAEQFERFVELSQRQGGVIAIGHPYAETLRLLERELPRLRERGVRLVPVSALVEEHSSREEESAP